MEALSALPKLCGSWHLQEAAAAIPSGVAIICVLYLISALAVFAPHIPETQHLSKTLSYQFTSLRSVMLLVISALLKTFC